MSSTPRTSTTYPSAAKQYFVLCIAAVQLLSCGAVDVTMPASGFHYNMTGDLQGSQSKIVGPGAYNAGEGVRH